MTNIGVYRMRTLLMCIVCIFLLSILQPIESNAAKGRKEFEQTGNVIWDIPTRKKIVAITFDDGPHAVYTPEILSILEEYNAKATFFVVGSRAENYKSIVRREVGAGHEVENHTFTHHSLSGMSSKEVQEEIQKAHQTITSITNQRPTFFRPVGGLYNDAVVDAAVDEGYRVVLWSWHQDSKDWQQPGVDKIVKNVLSGVRPGDVVLFHDAGGNRTQTIKALPIILSHLQKQGYKFVTVSQLLQQTGHDKIPSF